MYKLCLSSFLAGVLIALGGTANLLIENKIAGAIFFCIGLFLICEFGLHLFTGRVCFCGTSSGDTYAELAVILLMNLIGALWVALALQFTRTGRKLTANAEMICATKAADDPISLLILSIFCGVMICVAVVGYQRLSSPISRIVCLFLSVSVFVLCGFEHIIADFYYYCLCGVSIPLLNLCSILLGNITGGVLTYQIFRRVI